MNLMNLVGNAILIFGFGMGVAGAAISTTVSRTTAALIIFYLLFQKDKVICFKHRVTARLNMEQIKRILYIGIPNGLENSLFQLGKILLLSLVSTFGTSAIAANAVCGTIANFNILPGMAINMAIVSVTSYCIGAGDYGQTRYYTKKLMRLTSLCMIAVSVIMILFGRKMLLLYHLTPETEELAMQVIRYHAIMCMFAWVPSFSLPNTLRAAGDVMWTMVIAIVSMWVFRIGTAYFFSNAFHLGLMGIWIAMTIDWMFRGVCYEIRYHSGKWEKAMKNKA